MCCIVVKSRSPLLPYCGSLNTASTNRSAAVVRSYLSLGRSATVKVGTQQTRIRICHARYQCSSSNSQLKGRQEEIERGGLAQLRKDEKTENSGTSSGKAHDLTWSFSKESVAAVPIVGSEQKVVRPEATATGPWGMQEAGWRACDQSYSIPLTSSSTCMGAVSICPFSVRSCPLIASPQYSPTQLQYNLTDIAAEMSRSPSVGRSLWLYVAKAADGKPRLRPALPTTLPMLEWIAVSFTPLLTELLSSRCRKPDRRRAMSVWPDWIERNAKSFADLYPSALFYSWPGRIQHDAKQTWAGRQVAIPAKVHKASN